MTRPAVRGTESSKLAVYEAYVDATHDALFSLDATMRVEHWNRNAERIFGHRAGDIVGEPVATLFPRHACSAVESLFDAALAGDRVDRALTEIERKDGMPVPIALSVRPVRDGDGRCTGFVGVVRDLTEQRLAQAALAESEARLREAEAMAHAGRWLWDVASDAVQWSEEMHRIHGITASTFDGTLQAHLAVVHPDDIEDLRGALTAAIETGRTLDHEYRILLPEGGQRRIYARAEPSLGSGGAVAGLRGFAQDVTDRAG